jgi:hypothetical protein
MNHSKERNMKRLLVAVCSLAFVLVLSAAGFAANPRGNAKLTVSGKTVSVEYGRPSLNGRTVDQLLGQLPEGEVWRLGADKSTTFTASGDLKFGDVTIPKGEYSLWARKEGSGWKLVFNKQHGQWGTNHDAAQDLAAVPLKVETESKPAEQVTITLEEEKGAGEISIQWGTMELSATFK